MKQPHKRAELFGPGDAHLRRLREAFSVRFHARHAIIRIIGEPAGVAKAAAAVERLQAMLALRGDLTSDQVEDVLDEVNESEGKTDVNAIRVFSGEPVAPKTDGQRDYVQAMFDNDLVICGGPAGTGKTYLAVAVAVHLLKLGKVKRICLVRPAVEAGERLGFLPGDLQQKVNPYLRPLFDAMHDMMTFDQLKRFMVNDIVEVIPLAYMRGRTLNHSIIILDEAQNATPGQMLMFLTRLGHHSKMIVTGDDSQVDLERDQRSGLVDAARRLSGVRGVSIQWLERIDIVRHRLVQEIVHRYGAPDRAQERRNSDKLPQETAARTPAPGMDQEAASEPSSNR